MISAENGIRKCICIEVAGTIDTTQPIDYGQLYAQAMYEIYHGERYWFNEEDEAIMTESNREFEQTPPTMQLFYRSFKASENEKDGEYLSPMEILDFIQKTTSIPLSSCKVSQFGRLLKKDGIPSKHTKRGTVYRVVKL